MNSNINLGVNSYNINNNFSSSSPLPSSPLFPFSQRPLSRIADKVWSVILNPLLTNPNRSSILIDQLLSFNNHFKKVLSKGLEIFPAAADLIANAEYSVCFVTYMWTEGCDPEKALAEGVYRATKRRAEAKRTGQPFQRLKIRIVADDCPGGSALVKSGFKQLSIWKRKGKFNSEFIDLSIGSYTHLLADAVHSKYMVVDNKYVLITGDNVYAYSNFNEDSWFDSGYILQGPVANTAQSDFEYIWKQVQVWNCPDDESRCYLTYHSPISHFPQSFSNSNNGFPVIALPQCSSFGLGRRSTWTYSSPQDQAFIAAIRAATKSLYIVTPNLNAIPFLSSLLIPLRHGTQVKLLTSNQFDVTAQNLPGHGGDNEQALHWWFSCNKNELEPLLETEQLQIRYFRPASKKMPIGGKAQANHTKLMIIDESVSIVGSANHDTQSWERSQEFNLLLDDQETTLTIANTIFFPQWNSSLPIKNFPTSSSYWALNIGLAILVFFIVWALLKYRFGAKRSHVYIISFVALCVFAFFASRLTPREKELMGIWSTEK